MYSLAQKRFMAKRDGKDEVVLTMEEVESILAQLSNLDGLVAKYMDYVPEKVLNADMNCSECGLHPYVCKCGLGPYECAWC